MIFSPRLARGFAFAPIKAVLVRKNRRPFGTRKPKVPSGRELSRLAVTEGERDTKKYIFTLKKCCFDSHAGSFRLATRATSLSEGGS